jgi:hypothetical protein
MGILVFYVDAIDDANESNALLPSDIQILSNHHKECGIAFFLCMVGMSLDFMRWVILLVLRRGMTPYYYDNPKIRVPVVISMVEDFLIFFLTAALYNLHKDWIQLRHYGRWNRFIALGISTLSRVFMFIPMMWGNPHAPLGWRRFCFLSQIVGYGSLIFSWILPASAYFMGWIWNSVQMIREEPSNVTVVDLNSSSLHQSIETTSVSPKCPVPATVSNAMVSSLSTPLSQSILNNVQPEDLDQFAQRVANHPVSISPDSPTMTQSLIYSQELPTNGFLTPKMYESYQ